MSRRGRTRAELSWTPNRRICSSFAAMIGTSLQMVVSQVGGSDSLAGALASVRLVSPSVIRSLPCEDPGEFSTYVIELLARRGMAPLEVHDLEALPWIYRRCSRPQGKASNEFFYVVMSAPLAGIPTSSGGPSSTLSRTAPEDRR